MSQANKHLQSIQQLSQNTTILTNKQVQQAQALIQKCLPSINQYDKIVFTKFITLFFKIFLQCPNSSSQIFYKKYYSILKEGYQYKSKSYYQQRYDCLINVLFETGEKYFSSLFIQAMKNIKNIAYSELMNYILSISIKGGLNLRGFANLLRKYVQKDSENCRNIDVYGVFKEIFFKIYNEIVQQMMKGGKLYESYSFKWFLFNILLEQLTSKFENQASAFIKQLLLVLTKSDDQVNTKILSFIQFLSLNEPNLHKVIGQNSIYLKQGNHYKRSLFIDLMATLQMLQQVHSKVTHKQAKFHFHNILLLRNRFISIANAQQNRLNERNSVYLEKLLLQMLMKVRLHQGLMEQSKLSLLMLTKTIITINSSFFAKFLFNQPKYPELFTNQFYEKLLADSWLTFRSKIYLILLCKSILVSQNNDYSSILMIQTHIFKIFKDLLSKKQQESDQYAFFSQLYMLMNFKKSKKDYLKEILGQQQQSNIIDGIRLLYQSKMNSVMAEQKTVVQLIKQNITSLQVDRYTFQNLVDLITYILNSQAEQEQIINKSTANSDFNQLSLVLFDQINIKPKIIQEKQEFISFNNQKIKPKTQFCITLFTQLYQSDKTMKSNAFLMKSVPANEASSQKIIVIALRKYFGIFYNRINQFVIRKWIINRNFLILWALMLSNYKVKTIAEQILKCGISSQQIISFLKVQHQIVKDFLQYLMTKDKFRFKLALFNCGLQHRKELIDYFLLQLLL